jgi:hypothetical protein
MPEPMVALPCGSRSTTSTRWPTRARPAARFTVVVVLPTPPFWLATQKMRGRSRRSLRAQADAEADEEDAGQLFERARQAAVRAHLGADGVGKGAQQQAIGAVMAAMVTAMAAKVTMPRCVAGLMNSGKKAM